jgi:hypothetical protein
MPISSFSTAKVLSFPSVMRKIETPVTGIKQFLKPWCFRGVVIEMKYR